MPLSSGAQFWEAQRWMLLGVQRMELPTRLLHLRRLVRHASRSIDSYWYVPNVEPEHFSEKNQPAARLHALGLGLQSAWQIEQSQDCISDQPPWIRRPRRGGVIVE